MLHYNAVWEEAKFKLCVYDQRSKEMQYGMIRMPFVSAQDEGVYSILP
jgi:hypothetical protein